MPLNIKLQAFEGPLDLLLYLIDKNKVDIYDIPIVLITEQYLEHIGHLDISAAGASEEEMNLMSEFLVMAATLLHIKCRMLLPVDETTDETDEDEDPRTELLNKLLEYKMYKFISVELRAREESAGRSIYRPMSLPDELKDYQEPIDYEALLGDASLKKLHEHFEATLRRLDDKIDPIRSKFSQVQKDEIDMERKMAYVEAYLEKYGSFSFIELLERQNNKMEIIVTFLVILELMRIGRIGIRQDDIKDDIRIEVKVNGAKGKKGRAGGRVIYDG